jgi:hypothetical protein
MRASIKSGDKFGKLVVIKQNGIHKSHAEQRKENGFANVNVGILLRFSDIT